MFQIKTGSSEFSLGGSNDALARALSLKSTHTRDFDAKGYGIQTILVEGLESKSVSGSLARFLSIKSNLWCT